MKKIAWMLAAVLVAATTAACGSSSGASCNTGSPFYSQIQGSWSMCMPQDPAGGTNYTMSLKNNIVVSGCNITTVTATLYPTSLNCTGTAVPVATGTGSVAIGNSQSANFNLGGPTVTAYQLDVTYNITPASGGSSSSSTLYTLGYVPATDSTKLYMGDITGSADSGTTPDKRPTTLDSRIWFAKLLL